MAGLTWGTSAPLRRIWFSVRRFGGLVSASPLAFTVDVCASQVVVLRSSYPPQTAGGVSGSQNVDQARRVLDKPRVSRNANVTDAPRAEKVL